MKKPVKKEKLSKEMELKENINTILKPYKKMIAFFDVFDGAKTIQPDNTYSKIENCIAYIETYDNVDEMISLLKTSNFKVKKINNDIYILDI